MIVSFTSTLSNVASNSVTLFYQNCKQLMLWNILSRGIPCSLLHEPE